MEALELCKEEELKLKDHKQQCEQTGKEVGEMLSCLLNR